jgi:hypothetical protein
MKHETMTIQHKNPHIKTKKIKILL